MQALYDSKTNRLDRRGEHSGQPRLWTVTLWLHFENQEVEKTIFRVAKKCQVSELAEVVDEHSKARIVVRNMNIVRTRWHAIAR